MIRSLPPEWWANTDVWTPEEFVNAFWPKSRHYVIRIWQRLAYKNHLARFDDLMSVAGEALWNTALDFGRLAADYEDGITGKLLFWNLAKKRIDWDIQRFAATKARVLDPMGRSFDSVEKMEDQHEEGESETDWVRTQLRAPERYSTVHREIASYLPTLPIREQVVMALFFYEEGNHRWIAQFLEFSRSMSGNIARSVTADVLQCARGRVSNHVEYLPARKHRPWEPTEALTEWLKETYSATVPEYLERVNSAYFEDVSYIVDMIDMANGKRFHRWDEDSLEKPMRRDRRLAPDQVIDMRARWRAGQSKESLAREFSMSTRTIHKIVTGMTYADVEGVA